MPDRVIGTSVLRAASTATRAGAIGTRAARGSAAPRRRGPGTTRRPIAPSLASAPALGRCEDRARLRPCDEGADRDGQAGTETPGETAHRLHPEKGERAGTIGLRRSAGFDHAAPKAARMMCPIGRRVLWGSLWRNIGSRKSIVEECASASRARNVSDKFSLLFHGTARESGRPGRRNHDSPPGLACGTAGDRDGVVTAYDSGATTTGPRACSSGFSIAEIQIIKDILISPSS